jgi:hypothetical protein
MTSTRSDERADRRAWLPVALFITAVCWLAFVGAFVVVRALVGWMT